MVVAIICKRVPRMNGKVHAPWSSNEVAMGRIL